MGAATSKLNVKQLLEAAGDSNGVTVTPVVEAGGKEAAAAALVKLSIEVGPDEDEAALGQALALAQDGAFWAKHAGIHPNGKRLSFWLWVHEKYRQYCDDLLRKAEELASTPSAQRPAKAKPVLAAYNKFTKKIGHHSNFEDTQLFKYFEDHHSDKLDLTELRKQHDDLRTTEEVRESLTAMVDGKEATEDELKGMLDKVRALHAELNEHLDLEEATLAPVWLSLTDEQVKTLRTYFSWYYAAMY